MHRKTVRRFRRNRVQVEHIDDGPKGGGGSLCTVLLRK